MSKVFKKGRKTTHRGLHALTPTRITVTKTGQSLFWTDVRQELKDVIRLENDTIQSYLDDPDWTGRFNQTLKAYQSTHDGKTRTGLTLVSGLMITSCLWQSINLDHGYRPNLRRFSPARL